MLGTPRSIALWPLAMVLGAVTAATITHTEEAHCKAESVGESSGLEGDASALLQTNGWKRGAVQKPSLASALPCPEPGVLNRVVWMAWTGNNTLPSHLNLALQTVRRNAGLPVIVVTPENMAKYVPKPHPAYEYLGLEHKADYLRTYLLHTYGGIWLDSDVICLKSLAGLFEELNGDKYDAVGHDGTPWGETIGLAAMGPFRPQTALTKRWFGGMNEKLDQRLEELKSKNQDVLAWAEMLRGIFLPVSKAQREKISKALQAINPEKDQIMSIQPAAKALGCDLEHLHMVIMKNAIYGWELAQQTEEQLLGGKAVLSQLFRRALTT